MSCIFCGGARPQEEVRRPWGPLSVCPTFSWFLPVPVNVSRLLCAHHSRRCHLSSKGADVGLYVQGNAIHMESTV